MKSTEEKDYTRDGSERNNQKGFKELIKYMYQVIIILLTKMIAFSVSMKIWSTLCVSLIKLLFTSQVLTA